MPLVGLTPSQLLNLMCSSKLYIDFGHHPREGSYASRGCNFRLLSDYRFSGSACNSYDIPVSRFKLDPDNKDFYSNLNLLISDIFNNFDSVSLEFNDYRKSIANEKSPFKKQVAEIFNE